MHIAVKSLVEAHITIEVTTEDLALNMLTPLLHASVESGVRCLMRFTWMSRVFLQGWMLSMAGKAADDVTSLTWWLGERTQCCTPT